MAKSSSQFSEFPAHEKLQENKEEHETIVSFIGWLSDHKDFAVCTLADTGYSEPFARQWMTMSDRGKGDLIAEYFGIDIDQFDREKEQMFTSLRIDSINRREESG